MRGPAHHEAPRGPWVATGPTFRYGVTHAAGPPLGWQQRGHLGGGERRVGSSRRKESWGDLGGSWEVGSQTRDFGPPVLGLWWREGVWDCPGALGQVPMEAVLGPSTPAPGRPVVGEGTVQALRTLPGGDNNVHHQPLTLHPAAPSTQNHGGWWGEWAGGQGLL